MRFLPRLALVTLVWAAGCSTAPIAGLLDRVRPGRLEGGSGPFYGGVQAVPCPPVTPAAPPVLSGIPSPNAAGLP
jgi:hypothetical protein